MRSPLLFVGHGNPMNAIVDNEYSQKWEDIGKQLDRPRAIVCMSAHWLTDGNYITSNLHPKIIYDFYGFPEKLYHVQYPVQGDKAVAQAISRSCNDAISLSSQWGIDHGAWSVLKRMFPNADVPVLQLSIDFTHPPRDQFQLMHHLSHMREEGILFVGSGNIVHNLGMMRTDGGVYDWALEFEKKAKHLIGDGQTESLIDHAHLGHAARMAIPTDDHYRPLLNTLSLVGPRETPTFFNEGIDMGSVSMLSFLMK